MTTLQFTDVTTGTLNGTGIFDQMMATMIARLSEEYSRNRITGVDYSKVYLGAMDSAMQQSIAFLLGKDTSAAQAELIAAQKLLVDEQIKNAVEETKLSTAKVLQLQAETIKAQTENSILLLQVNKTQAEIDILEQELLNTQEQRTILQAQKLQLEAETRLSTQKLLESVQAVSLSQTEQNSYVNKNAKVDQETLLLKQQVINTATENTVLAATKLKVEAEKALIAIKGYAEEAQYRDNVNGSAVTGLIAKQKAIYVAQEYGFYRDAEHKAAKIATEAWAIRYATNPTQFTPPVSLGDTAINALMAKVSAGLK